MSQLNIRKLSGKGNQPVEALTGITSETAPTGVKHLTRKDYVDNSIINAINAIGLGTAATKNVATNAEALAGATGVLTDAAGVHAAFGQYGLGDAVKAAPSDLNDIGATGFYIFGSRTNQPTSSLAGFILLHTKYSASNATQICSDSNGNLIFYRGKNNSVWSDWRELHHTGNILTTTGTSTEFPMSQKAVTEAVDAAASAASAAQAAANVNQASISNATDTGSATNTHLRQVNAGTSCIASGYRSQVNASESSNAIGASSQVNASAYSAASGANSQVNASTASSASGDRSQVNVSRVTENNTLDSSVWGYAPSGARSTANQQIRLESDGGVGRFKGNVTTSGFDYAEYFPNLNKGTISNGTIVTLSEDKVKPAQEGDFILGVVSGTSGIIGNSAEFCWHKRHLVDEFGVTITEDAEMVSFDDYYGLVSECSKPIPSDAKRWIEAIPVENPDYIDISSEYQSRGERKEDWSIIGLMGQVFVRTSEQLEEGDYVSASGSKSVQETRLRVMKMTTDFDPNKGYGVAFCLIR